MRLRACGASFGGHTMTGERPMARRDDGSPKLRYSDEDGDREALVDIAAKDEEKRDKAIVALSSAAIGICAAFVRGKVPDQILVQLLFALALVAFSAALSAALWSMHWGAEANWRTIRVRDASKRMRESPLTSRVRWLNTV
ncbi:MAG: hypothetical protein AAGD14_14000 [Planctomycetota bacterium]